MFPRDRRLPLPSVGSHSGCVMGSQAQPLAEARHIRNVSSLCIREGVTSSGVAIKGQRTPQRTPLQQWAHGGQWDNSAVTSGGNLELLPVPTFEKFFKDRYWPFITIAAVAFEITGGILFSPLRVRKLALKSHFFE